jgi:hypothetical protein
VQHERNRGGRGDARQALEVQPRRAAVDAVRVPDRDREARHASLGGKAGSFVRVRHRDGGPLLAARVLVARDPAELGLDGQFARLAQREPRERHVLPEGEPGAVDHE